MTSEDPTSEGSHDANYYAVPILSSVIAILKDPAALKIIKKIKPKFKPQGLMNSIKNLRDALSSNSNNVNSTIKAFNQSIKSFKQIFSTDIYSKSINFSVCRIEDTVQAIESKKTKKQVLNQVKKQYSLLQEKTDFDKLEPFDRKVVKTAIEAFKSYIDILKSAWESQGFSEICYRSQNKEYIDRLETELNEMLLLSEMNYRIQKIESALEAIDQKADEVELPPQPEHKISMLFQKKCSKTFNLEPIQLEPIEIGPSVAIPEEKEIMENRMSLYDSIISLSKQYPKPYERRDELMKENQELKKRISNGNIPKEVLDDLIQDNENLRKLINKMEIQKNDEEEENPFGF